MDLNRRSERAGRSARLPGRNQARRSRGEVHQPVVHLADGRREFSGAVSVAPGALRIAQSARADEFAAGIGVNPQFPQNRAADLFRPLFIYVKGGGKPVVRELQTRIGSRREFCNSVFHAVHHAPLHRSAGPAPAGREVGQIPGLRQDG